MKARILLASLLMMVGLAGCGSTGKQFLYTTGPGTPEIFQFQIRQNGSITALNPGNSASGTSPVSVLIHPSGNFAYIANFAGATVTLLMRSLVQRRTQFGEEFSQPREVVVGVVVYGIWVLYG